MKMTEKNKRSVANATAALEAYEARVNGNDELIASIGDLIADLLILATTSLSEDDIAAGGEFSADGLVTTAVDHCRYELDPANADDEV